MKKSDVAQLAAQVQYEYASGRRATAKIRPVNFAVVTGRDRPVVIPPPSPDSWVNNAEQ